MAKTANQRSNDDNGFQVNSIHPWGLKVAQRLWTESNFELVYVRGNGWEVNKANEVQKVVGSVPATDFNEKMGSV